MNGTLLPQRRYIVCEEQAERVGERRTGGKRGVDFTVFRYEEKRSRLTLFGVMLKASGTPIHFD